MDMAELAARTGLPVRKLRYVFDHQVLPGLQGASAGHGIPRTFTDYEGFGIALAAHLLDAGLTRKVVAAVLAAACRPTRLTHAPADVPLYRAYIAQAGSLEIGDGRHLRVRAPRCPGLVDALDTGWLPMEPSGRVARDYTPAVCMTVELGGLAQAVQEFRGRSRTGTRFEHNDTDPNGAGPEARPGWSSTSHPKSAGSTPRS